MTLAAASPLVPQRLRARIASMSTTGQVVGSFVAVLVAYWLYWLIAVPLIEPGIDPRAVSSATDDQIHQAREATSARKQALAAYFPPGSWELDNPAIWETDTTMLLFKTPRPLPDGQLELRHCTMLFFPRTREPVDSVKVRPIVMRATEGATLRFDEPIVMKNVDLGKRQLVGGHLKGLITIDRAASRPGAADDLAITTRDIELVGDRAFSPHPVEFRMGHSHGSGRDLEILLASDGSGPGAGFRSGKARALLLKRDVVMYLAMDDAPGGAGPAANANKPAAPQSPVKITCQGAFQYDFVHYAASFHDRVDIVRPTLGQSDVLNCELLTVFFEGPDQPDQAVKPPSDQPKPAAPNGEGSQVSKLPVRKIEARGEPVTLVSPARGIYIQCRGLDYYPAPAGAIGRMVGLGPGVMQGSVQNNPAGKYRIQWTREFGFEPAENGQYRASLQGGATVRMAGMGEITASDRLDAAGRLAEEGRIFAWLSPIAKVPAPSNVATIRPVSVQVAQGKPELPTGPQGGPAGGAANPAGPNSTGPSSTGNENWQLERMLAQGNVRIDVPQLDGATDKLEVWVERPQATAGPIDPGAPTASPSNPQQPPARKPRTNPQQNPTQRFAVRAGGIQVKLIPDGQQFAVTNITLDARAHLEELTPRPGEKPMVVAGDRLHVAGANTEQTRVTVVGKLAHIEATGVDLLGETIELEKHTNRLWVNGPGRMLMPMTQDLDGKPLEQPQTVEIKWAGRMAFQGNTVVFERDVRVTSQQQLLTTQKLEATLSQPIDFAHAGAAGLPRRGGRPEDGPQLAQIRCIGEAFLSSRELDLRGQQTSFTEMQLFDLSIDRVSGAVEARGPGWLRRVARATANGPRPGLPGQPAANAAPKAPPKGLTYLHVTFQRWITGNLNQRELTFGEPTKTVYAPVDDWNARLNAEEPASLGPEGMVMDANKLTVREMPARDKNQKNWFELVAVGNVLVEGTQFVALGHRALYVQNKDQLVLEGDGRSPAEISYASVGGGARNEAKANRIVYDIALQHVVISGAQSMGLDVPQNRPPKAPKAK